MTDDSQPLYVTIGAMWECQACGTTGRYGILDRAVHHFLRHSPGWFGTEDCPECDGEGVIGTACGVTWCAACGGDGER